MMRLSTSLPCSEARTGNPRIFSIIGFFRLIQQDCRTAKRPPSPIFLRDKKRRKRFHPARQRPPPTDSRCPNSSPWPSTNQISRNRLHRPKPTREQRTGTTPHI